MAKLITQVIRLGSSLGIDEAELHEFGKSFLEPLWELLERFPQLRLGIAINGILLERFLERGNSGFIHSIATLHKKGRIEIILAPYSDPYLPALSPAERLEELELVSNLWEANGITGLKTVTFREFSTDEISEQIATSQGLRILSLPSTPQNPTSVEASAINKPSTVAAPVLTLGTEFLFLPRHDNDSYSPLGPAAELLAILTRAATGDTKFLLPQELPQIPAGAKSSPQPPISGGMAHEAFFTRTNVFRQDLQQFLAKQFNKLTPAATDQHSLVKRYLHRCFVREIYPPDIFVQPPFRRELIRNLIYAQVALDKLNSPEIDPTIGWVRLEDSKSENSDKLSESVRDFVIDTQLVRHQFSNANTGCLLAYEFKPRKFDLANVFTQTTKANSTTYTNCPTLAFTLYTAPTATNPNYKDPVFLEPVPYTLVGETKPKILKRTRDLLTLRFQSQLNAKPAGQPEIGLTLYKDITIKAGVGAYIHDATTGFSVEYWLEGETPPPSTLYCALSFYLALATPSSELLCCKPLLPFGATATERYEFGEYQTISHQSLPAGLHGLRAIDGLEDHYVEIRSAKPLHSLTLKPHQAASTYQGTETTLILPATKIFDDSHSNTLFLSIE